MTDTSPDNSDNDSVVGALTEDQQRIISAWRSSLAMLDPRYEARQLARIAARSLVDSRFRANLVAAEAPASTVDDGSPAEGQTQPESATTSPSSTPPATTVVFHANTPTMLHVVLPALESEITGWPRPLQDALRSRTSTAYAASGWFQDDWTFDNDPAVDPPIVIGPGLPDGLDLGDSIHP